MSYRKAIEEQQALVAANPNEARLRQTLGDLFLKAGDEVSAADAYEQVAIGYARDGHFMKAVALIKQVIKMDGRRARAREALAGWYLTLSLQTEGISEYRSALRQYQAAGSAPDVVRVVELLAALGETIAPGPGRG